MGVLRLSCLLGVVTAGVALGDGVIYLKGGSSGMPCKVLEVTDDYVLVKIPRSEVIRIDPGGGARREDEQPTGGAPPGPASSAAAGVGKQIRAEAREGTGSAVGQMLWDGKLLANCRLKIALLEAPRLFGASRLIRIETEAVTDDAGRFRFDGLPPGRYKLFWAAPAATHWVRRLRIEPDFEVVAGQETVIEPLEAHVSTLN